MPRIIRARQIAISNANNPFTGGSGNTLFTNVFRHFNPQFKCFNDVLHFILALPGPIRFVKFTGLNRNGIVNRVLT
ncbi:hypothetical protein BDFB_014246 [Asbolus verrucosus]|uniref:Uncharacterized protein n=1 Tax=Asbolus verrucosus TaxID=1661398 RepID=A0A482W240_ASBVE|nr:hypothetical protein BDFB_014246 [Asbolus verrucosus]